ncbi:hypothetical protein NLJ89_g7545 [Agrocybe chaxingu]|uniref:Uncharacterized protein n=1 Tax=Agrocybe chaxingu TaxID=84603 RepID=A0A9W8JWZ6_9AGAR|nr:hypothetical protein NLJ89_g7545 [Agrocybe chaxingu]
MPTLPEESSIPASTPLVNSELQQALQTVVQNLLAPALGGATQSKQVFFACPDPDETDKQGAKSYYAFGRIVSRQIDPFTKVDAIVNFGVLHDGKDSDSDTDDGGEQLCIRDQRLLEGWETLCRIIPSFKTSMLALSKERRLRKQACQAIQDGVNAVRTDDRSTLKDGILDCLLLDKNTPLSPPIARKSKVKAGRGFCHPATAALLSPIKYPVTDKNLDALRERKLPVTAAMLPRFLYPDNHIFDADDVENDVLRGHVLYRSAKMIFQGPSTAHDEPGAHRGQGGNAALCGLTSMTPMTIAYVAVQVRHALSNQSSWSNTDGTFNYMEFFWNLVDLFEDEESSKEIINFYNHHVFGTDAGANTSDPFEKPVEDDYEILKRQRAAKRARTNP